MDAYRLKLSKKIEKKKLKAKKKEANSIFDKLCIMFLPYFWMVLLLFCITRPHLKTLHFSSNIYVQLLPFYTTVANLELIQLTKKNVESISALAWNGPFLHPTLLNRLIKYSNVWSTLSLTFTKKEKNRHLVEINFRYYNW